MLAWLLFIIGLLVHLVAQVAAITAAPNNPDNSFLLILQKRWSTILVRSFISIMLFWILFGGGLPEFLSIVGVQAPDWIAKLATVVHMSGVGAAFSGLAGYFGDSALAFFPALKSSVPPPIFSNAQGGKP